MIGSVLYIIQKFLSCQSSAKKNSAFSDTVRLSLLHIPGHFRQFHFNGKCLFGTVPIHRQFHGIAGFAFIFHTVQLSHGIDFHAVDMGNDIIDLQFRFSGRAALFDG